MAKNWRDKIVEKLNQEQVAPPAETKEVAEKEKTPVQTVEKAQEKVETPKQHRDSPVVIMSELDSYIADRMIAQPSTIEEIQVRDVDTRTEAQHRLKLPIEVENVFKAKALSPRWIFKDKRAIDNALNVIGWTLVNRVYFPELPDYIFSANGTIEAGDAILAFMPKRRAEMIRELPAKKSREMVKNIPAQDLEKWEQRRDYHYKPASGVAESGEEAPTGRRGIVVTPDSDFPNE